MGIFDFLSKMGGEAKAAMEPALQARENMRFQIADALGKTKTMIDEGDASEYKVIDEEAYKDSKDGFMKAAQSMNEFTKVQPGVVPGTPVAMQQQPQMQAAYAPVNYQSVMPYGAPTPNMIGQQPTYEQLLMALRSRGY